jgi:hypothetical protein
MTCVSLQKGEREDPVLELFKVPLRWGLGHCTWIMGISNPALRSFAGVFRQLILGDFLFCFLCVCVCVGGQGLAMFPRLTWHSRSSCLSLLSAGITGKHHHAWFQFSYWSSSKFCKNSVRLDAGESAWYTVRLYVSVSVSL